LQPNTYEGYKLFHEGAIALAQVEFNGIAIDEQYVEKHWVQLGHELGDMEFSLKGTELMNEMEIAARKAKTSLSN